MPEDDIFYEAVAREMADKQINPAAWARAMAKAAGDSGVAHSLYIEFRVQQLREETLAQHELQRANQRHQGRVTCPLCGYTGTLTRMPKGQMFVGIMLLLLFIVPGLLYFVLFSGYRYICQNCGKTIKSDIVKW